LRGFADDQAVSGDPVRGADEDGGGFDVRAVRPEFDRVPDAAFRGFAAGS
jgi:hypothetical protein